MKNVHYLILLFVLLGCKEAQRVKPVDNMIIQNGSISYYMNKLDKPFKVLFLSDNHFTVEDERGKDFYPYTQRMGGAAVEPENYGKSNGRENALIASLEKAKQEAVELVILGGDMINFPSQASAERLLAIMNESGLKWMYIAGNHDWHYEGEPGEAAAQRDKWEQQTLNSLYQGANPLYASTILHAINFVLIDNSTNEITAEQLHFFKEQLAKGMPVILSMHIPLYLPGHNVDYGCGHPDWNAANDTYYEIERRIPWPAEGHSPTTREFRELVFNSPQVIGIYAGHTHEEVVDIYNHIPQYVAGANYNNKDILIHFIPAIQ